jgi:hypothetical protein
MAKREDNYMFFTGGPATSQISGLKERIEIKAFEFGYSLGQAGIDPESREGLKLTGDFVIKLLVGFGVEFLIGRFCISMLTDNDMCRQFDPEGQEMVRKFRQEVDTRVVRRGIEALGEGRL